MVSFGSFGIRLKVLRSFAEDEHVFRAATERKVFSDEGKVHEFQVTHVHGGPRRS